MISIDTNVLLRYLLQDDVKQSPKANKLMHRDEKILITDVVLAETIWTLKGKKYKLSKEQLLEVIQQLFKEPNAVFEDAQTVWRALNIFRETKPVKVSSKKKDADFTDVLILEKSRHESEKRLEQFGGMYSFDTAAQQIEDIHNP